MRYFFSVIMIFFVQACSSGDLKPFDFAPAKDPRGTIGLSTSCSFDNLILPSEFSVLAAGGHSGRETSFQIDQSGHSATQIDVAVNKPHKPVVLMLGAYNPTIWNIGWTADTKIIAVFVSGYNRQVVAGLPIKTPIIISTHDNNGPCDYFYVTSDKLGTLNPISRSMFGQPVDMVYPVRNGYVVVGDALGPKTRLVTSQSVTPESYFDKSATLAGPAGLAAAVDKGLLRKATRTDMAEWYEAIDKSNADLDIPAVAGIGTPSFSHRKGFHNAYVVLKPFTYPAGLYGGLSATFLVPKDVPTPVGNPGHSTVLDFKTLTCNGSGCR